MVGDRWALLILRELLLGNHRFDQLARNTGAPRDRLAVRLRDLESAGVVTREQYQERPARFEYRLTDSGRELAPVIRALRDWGDKWAVPEPPMVFRHTCGHEVRTVHICRHCGQQVHDAELTAESRVPEWDLGGPAVH
jgi:DNA-binding HxlR family transcriptional regulator